MRLLRTTTLAAWHGGIEHYVTSFQFEGGGAEFGSILPLPTIPTAIDKAGAWTLQRLEREVQPPVEFAAAGAAGPEAAADSVQVIEEKQIDALELTVLRGGGAAVGQWARERGFELTPDAPEILDYYAAKSPIFLAARFDAAAARQRGQSVGDGTPIDLTMPLPAPWVPLRILTLGRQPTDTISADVFLLTDTHPTIHHPEAGIEVRRTEPASGQLLTDLRSDRNSTWVPAQAWLTYLTIDGQAAQIDGDLSVDAPAHRVRRITPPPPTTTTTVPPATTTSTTTIAPSLPVTPAGHHRSTGAAVLVAASLVALVGAGTGRLVLTRQRRR
jgi:hypothetical protein